jgi:hypothetical protein
LTSCRCAFVALVNVVTLLLIHEGEKSHYVWVKSESALFASKTSHYKKHVCLQCLTHSFDCQRKLDEHMEICKKQLECRYEYPHAEDRIDEETGKIKKANNIMMFKNHGNEFKHPFHVVADFESTLLKVEETDEDKSTKKYQMHVPNSFGLKYNCIHDEHSEPINICNNSDPEYIREKFVLELEKLAKKSYDLTQLNKENIIMSDGQKIIHEYNEIQLHNTSNIIIIYNFLNNFKYLYYCIKFRNQFRNLLWIKVREPKIKEYYNPKNLIKLLNQMNNENDEEEFHHLINTW